jgi:hypothetical protein
MSMPTQGRTHGDPDSGIRRPSLDSRAAGTFLLGIFVDADVGPLRRFADASPFCSR